LEISSYYLSRIFKASSGNSFSSYVTEIKLQKATELLKEENFSVKEISSKLGYNSVQHFIKIFKEKYFSTPKEYQKEFHNNLLKQ
jgi:two-component system response regulator YesN